MLDLVAQDSCKSNFRPEMRSVSVEYAQQTQAFGQSLEHLLQTELMQKRLVFGWSIDRSTLFNEGNTWH